MVAERGRREAGRNAGRKKPNHRGLTTTPTDGGNEVCGRITQNLQLESLIAKYHLQNQPELDLIPHYNGAPGQEFLAVRTQGGARVLEELRWGYLPGWAANKPVAKRLINARSETVHQKPSFRAAFRERRCVIPENDWFEWRPENGEKQPYWIRPEGADVFSLAGVWESGGTSPGSMDTFVILTTQTVAGIADIHHRQPIILDDEAMEEWLAPGNVRERVIDTARKGSEGTYERRRVGLDVNDPRNDWPELLVTAMKSVPSGGEARSELALL